MQITRELLLAHKGNAVAERDQHLSSANACIGAINNLDHLLALLDLPEGAPATPPPPPSEPPAAPPR